MTTTLPILTEEEIRHAVPADEEAGFGSLATARGPLPLKAMDLNARIDGLVSEMSLSQTFVNTLDQPLEATYIFPLPDRAAVRRFRMEAGGRVIEGVLKERGEARREYDQAIREGHRAAISEQERQGVFTLRVGNVMPGEEATVRLNLVGPLPYCDGEATFRFPLVVAPRYIPGAPLPGPSVGDGVEIDTTAVPDASRIAPPVFLPGFPHPVRLSLVVDVAPSDLSPREFRSSLHAIVEEQQGGTRRIRLHAGERLDRDFILRFRLGEESIKTSLTLHSDTAGNGQGGTFLLTLVPPTSLARTAKPRDIVFVLDRSGSMGGWKLVAARRAMAHMVDTLTDQDRFTVLAFDNTVETPAAFQGQGLLPAINRNRFRAVEFLAKMEARGGTEMAQPLDQAVQELAGEERGRERILVLVTDGQVGNEDQILRNLSHRIRGIRIFTLGIDQAVNAAFLQRLAGLGGGVCALVESEDRLDEVMEQVHRRIDTPALTGLRFEPAGVRFDPDSVTPARLPDLFTGAPLYIMGRYQGVANGGLVLQATDAAGKPWLQTVQATPSANPAIPALWARSHLCDLEDRFAIGRRELERRIVETSLQFGVLCRFTAFVAVDRSEVVNPSGQPHKIIQPVELPSGWEVPGLVGLAAGGFQAAAAPATLKSCLKGDYASDALSQGSAGIFGSVARLFKRGTGSHGASPNLTLYRRRARKLAESLRKADSSNEAHLHRELADLAARLEALIDDLNGAYVALDEFKALVELRDELRIILRMVSTLEQLQQIRLKAEQVLQAFAGEPSPGRRADFWK